MKHIYGGPQNIENIIINTNGKNNEWNLYFNKMKNMVNENIENVHEKTK